MSIPTTKEECIDRIASLYDTHLELQEKYAETLKHIDQLQTNITILEKPKLTNAARILELQRLFDTEKSDRQYKLHMMEKSRDDYKTELEDLTQKHTLLEHEYQRELNNHQELIDRLILGNIENTEVTREKESVTEKLRKAKRLVKFIVKL